MDGISSLPDDVITHILSFLSIKEAALTSVLAKRWRILFAFSPNLFFVFHGIFSSSNKDEKLKSFLDRVLSVSGHSPIKEFTLYCWQGVEPAYIKRWLCAVLNRGVVDLGLRIDYCSLPFQIFTCNTLVKLKLYGFTVNELPENAFLPALQSLSLDNVQFFSSLEACAFAKLLSACPVLQDLYVTGLNWDQWKCCRAISSPSLKILTIMRFKFSGFDVSDFVSVTFDLPNLTYFRYFDFIPGSYPVVNLDSLVEANLHLFVTVDHTWDSRLADENDDNITSNATNMIKGLRNVEIMNLSLNSLEMFYFFKEAIPVFVNLFHLSIQPYQSSSECSWRGLPFLLNNSPNLETLIINGPLNVGQSGFGSSGYSCLLSCPVEVLKITKYSGNSEEVEQLKHFLGKFSSLELLEVTISGASEEKSQITKDLLMLPRASSKCKIKGIEMMNLYVELSNCDVHFLVSAPLYNKWTAQKVGPNCCCDVV